MYGIKTLFHDSTESGNAPKQDKQKIYCKNKMKERVDDSYWKTCH